MLSVMSFCFFVAMIADSLYEGASPSTTWHGVSRLNNRMSFYAYERRRRILAARTTLSRPKPSACSLSRESYAVSYVLVPIHEHHDVRGAAVLQRQ